MSANSVEKSETGENSTKPEQLYGSRNEALIQYLGIEKGQAPSFRFDSHTGEDLKDKPQEAAFKVLVQESLNSAEHYYGIVEGARFNPVTGAELPPVVEITVRDVNGNEIVIPDPESSWRRLCALTGADPGESIPSANGTSGQVEIGMYPQLVNMVRRARVSREPEDTPEIYNPYVSQIANARRAPEDRAARVREVLEEHKQYNANREKEEAEEQVRVREATLSATAEVLSAERAARGLDPVTVMDVEAMEESFAGDNGQAEAFKDREATASLAVRWLDEATQRTKATLSK